MNIIDIINKKRFNKELTSDEIKYIIDEYVKGNVEEYQMSAFLMAICINNMSDDETFYLTEAMLNSGEVIDLKEIGTTMVDKHSTGGVGDKTTMIVAPLVCACGMKIGKMSGRGLGFTGGTVDKLSSIPGFKMDFTKEEFINRVKDFGMCIATDNKDLVPADKKMYQLRDVTGTVDSIPLIASSIMSKKLASGCQKIVIDLKFGEGALINDMEDAEKLAKLMIKIGKHFDREVVCIISNMNDPLGNTIGNAIEVEEALLTLQGMGPEDLTKLCITIASYMVMLGKNIPMEDAMKLVTTKLMDKSAYEKFKEFIKYQGGDIDKLHISDNKIDVVSKDTGYIVDIDTLTLAKLVCDMGAGRKTIEDDIDYSVGIKLHKKVGDIVSVGDIIATAYYNKEIENIDSKIRKCFKFDSIKKDPNPLIYKIIK